MILGHVRRLAWGKHGEALSTYDDRQVQRKMLNVRQIENRCVWHDSSDGHCVPAFRPAQYQSSPPVQSWPVFWRCAAAGLDRTPSPQSRRGSLGQLPSPSPSSASPAHHRKSTSLNKTSHPAHHRKSTSLNKTSHPAHHTGNQHHT